MNRLNPLSKLIVLSLLAHTLLAQPSGGSYYRSAVMDSNDVITVFGNWGVIGQPADNRPRGAWMHPADGYIGDMSILLGVELPLKDYNSDGKPDTIHSVITCPVRRPAAVSDADPLTGEPWTFMPDSGFFNPSDTTYSVAMSNLPWTWPAAWLDLTGKPAWNGLYGMGKYAGNLETFFQMDDQNDRRYNISSNNSYGIAFKPDSMNLARMGLGIRMNVRYIQLAHPYFKDILFRVYDIKNEGTQNYSKVFFGTLTGTFVGVTGTNYFGEYDDDVAVLYKSDNLILFWDYPNDNSRNPFWIGPVGKCGEAFIDAPNQNHIASFYSFISGTVPLGNDSQFWPWLFPGAYKAGSGVINDTLAISGEDADYTYASDIFALPSGATKRIASVIAYGYSKNEILQMTLLAQVLYNNAFNLAALFASADLQGFSSHPILSGTQTINWTSSSSGGSATIFFSSDAGGTWQILADVPNSGSCQWNTLPFKDCPFALLRIFIKDAAGKVIGFAQTSDYFSIHNTTTGAPFVKMLNKELLEGASVTEPSYPLQFLIGNTESTPLTLTFSAVIGGVAVPFQQMTVESSNSAQTITVNFDKAPNSDKFVLRASLSDGNSTYSDSTISFAKQTQRTKLSQDNIVILAGHAEIPYEVHIVDKSKTTNSTFIVSFLDTSSNRKKTYSVFNQTSNSYVFKDLPFVSKGESPAFDGLAFYAEDTETIVDSLLWNTGVSGTFSSFVSRLDIPQVDIFGYPMPSDYRVVFSDTPIDTSFNYTGGETPIPIPMRVSNIQNNTHVKVIADFNIPQSYALYFVESIFGRNRVTWYAYISQSTSGTLPTKGDTMFVRTKRGLSIYDSLKIINVPVGVAVSSLLMPDRYSLEQNFPNPFNPATHFRFSIAPSAGGHGQDFVTLKVYDLLGREVALLVNERKGPGIYDVEWNASRFASGVYFVRLEAGTFSGIRKLVLIK